MTNYEFSLSIKGTVVDTTSLDEDDKKEAVRLFRNEFGWGEKMKRQNWKVDLTNVYDEDEDEES